MLKTSAGEMLKSGISVIANDAAQGKGKVFAILGKISAYPFKVLASFILAPVLLVKVAWRVENPIRRVVAIVGLIISLIAAYVAATLIGGVVGAIFVATHVGWIVGLGFLFGTTLSVYLSVTFSIIVFNSISWLFLKMNTQEVVEYINEIST